jgi:hypothetical protein
MKTVDTLCLAPFGSRAAMPLSRTRDMKISEQLRESIEEQIASGELAPGSTSTKPRWWSATASRAPRCARR